ncbi:hypothetical protein KGP17_11110 [Serratia sp. JSRIV001]|uniref:hypothetical protein n=1 Tax=unclassified Serratia (in: enterobacteria) TaxID=2647522 RepID=UPI001CBED4BB|nr:MULTISPECIES: hypothetical protein [unclassified Serratia (in: enterobacteria)]UAN48029.1 hypothetical protein KGP17_11110 [Serratia sp. JSRIV001]UAN53810.1 hypothetical protein KGP26_12465 [Serratia sp. JSRIV002]UAN65135.1 hypothetical protein KGP16_11430 [Serratia sp. JSRIV006]
MIEHQQQPTFNTCMSACIAMVASRPVDEVVELWHEKFHAKTDWLDDALDHYGIPYFYGHPKQGTLRNGFVYFLSVASLNIVGGLHQVIAILVEGDKPVFLDPVMGRPGSKYYVFGEPKTDSEASIISWTVDLAVPLAREQKA